jgi:hypothetical protein
MFGTRKFVTKQELNESFANFEIKVQEMITASLDEKTDKMLDQLFKFIEASFKTKTDAIHLRCSHIEKSMGGILEELKLINAKINI